MGTSSRNRFGGLLLAPLLLVPAVSCGPGRPGPPPPLRVCLESNPRDLDPRYGSDESSRRLHALLHAGLVRSDASGSPIPDLAESWEVLGATRIRFRLRDGLRFSDGRSLTSEDVRATLASVTDPGSRSFRHGDLRVIESIETRGERELDLTLREPFAPLLTNLNLGILPADQTGPDFAGPALGAGPYRLVEALPDRHLRLEANPHFHEGPPRNAALTLKVLPSETTRTLELSKGSLDLTVNDLPPDLVERFRSDPGFRVVTSPGSSYSYLGFNMEDPLLSRAEVRRAVAMSIDREAIIRHLLRGLARPATGLLPPAHWAYEPTAAPEHDPDGAEALLDSVGLRRDGPRGTRLRLTYKTSTSDLANQQAQIIQENLRAVGIEVEIRSAEWSTFYDDVVHGRFQLYSLTWTEILDPDIYRLRFGSRYLPPQGLNRGRYRSARVDRLLDDGIREADPERRREIYAEVQRILAEDLPYVSLWHRDNIAVMRARVQGLQLSPTADFRALKDVVLTP